MIFISYRKEDAGDMALSLADKLIVHFGKNSVFLDRRQIEGGDKWREEIDNALSKAAVVLAVIGPRWLTTYDEYGQRRIDRDDDVLAQELSVALQRGLVVIPLYLHGLKPMPAKAFPARIADLAAQQGIEFDIVRDLSVLLAKLEEVPGLRKQDQSNGAAAVASRSDASRKPWQIRPCALNFTDRKNETKILVDALQSGTSRVAFIHGFSGTGKSELALLVADRLRSVVPDGAFYLDLRGNEAVVKDRPTPDAIMRHVISSIDPKLSITAEPSAIVGQYHSILTGRKVLLLLDNAYDVAQVQSLIPPNPSLLIITSLRVLKLPGCVTVPLEPFAPDDAAEFLRSLHTQVIGHEKTIARLCGNLPLALRLAAAALEKAPHLTVEKYVARLTDAVERHRCLKDVDAAIDVTCELLDPKLRDCFYALCVFADGFEPDEAARIWNVDARDAEEFVSTLCEFNLVKWNSAKRVFEIHDLIRDYIRMKVAPNDEIVFRTRHAELASALAEQAHLLFKVGGEQEEGLALWDAKCKDIMQALSWSASRLQDDARACELAADIADSSWRLFEVRYPIQARDWLVAIGLHASERLNDNRRRSVHLRRLGFLLLDRGKPADAEKILVEAIELSQLMKDQEGEGIAFGYVGRAYLEQGRVEQGIAALKRSLTIAEEREDMRQIGISLGRLGDVYVNIGNNSEALTFYKRAIDIETRIDDIGGLAIDCTKTGNILRAADDIDGATEQYEMAAAAQRRLSNMTAELQMLIQLAGLYIRMNRDGQFDQCANRIVGIVVVLFGNAYEEMDRVRVAISRLELWPLIVRIADAMIRHFPDKCGGWIGKAAAARHVESAGGLTTAVQVLLDGRKLFPKEDIFAYDLACYTALLGDLDGAMTWLREASTLCGSNDRIRAEAANDGDLKSVWDRLNLL